MNARVAPRRAVAVFLCLVAIALAGCDLFRRTVDIEAVFPRANELRTGDLVLLEGREIGRVGDVRAADGGTTAVLRLTPEDAARVHGEAVAVYTDHPGTRRVEIRNPVRPGKSVADGSRIRGIGNPFELGAWHAEQALRDFGIASETWLEDAMRAIDDLGRNLQQYFDSEEWRRTEAEIDRFMRSLEGESRRAIEEATRQYEQLLTDLSAQAEALRQRGQDAAASALEALLEALRRALDTRRDEVIET